MMAWRHGPVRFSQCHGPALSGVVHQLLIYAFAYLPQTTARLSFAEWVPAAGQRGGIDEPDNDHNNADFWLAGRSHCHVVGRSADYPPAISPLGTTHTFNENQEAPHTRPRALTSPSVQPTKNDRLDFLFRRSFLLSLGCPPRGRLCGIVQNVFRKIQGGRI